MHITIGVTKNKAASTSVGAYLIIFSTETSHYKFLISKADISNVQSYTFERCLTTSTKARQPKCTRLYCKSDCAYMTHTIDNYKNSS